MGTYAMSQLREAAMRNFRNGCWNFRLFGATIRIQHKHTNQFAVVVYDPVAGKDAEILRIVNGEVPMFV